MNKERRVKVVVHPGVDVTMLARAYVTARRLGERPRSSAEVARWAIEYVAKMNRLEVTVEQAFEVLDAVNVSAFKLDRSEFVKALEYEIDKVNKEGGLK